MREKAWINFAKAGEKVGEKNFSPSAGDAWEHEKYKEWKLLLLKLPCVMLIAAIVEFL